MLAFALEVVLLAFAADVVVVVALADVEGVVVAAPVVYRNVSKLVDPLHHPKVYVWAYRASRDWRPNRWPTVDLV